jgi:outer membrane biosynthesis protein TonB
MGCLTTRFTALFLILLLGAAPGLCGAQQSATPSSTPAPQQQTPTQQPDKPAIQEIPPASTVPPGASDTQPIPQPAPNEQPVEPAPQPIPDAPSATLSGTSGQTVPSQQPQNDQQPPAGTAAAKIGNPKGGLASRPAGAAIAPSPQRRSRSLLIKMGLLAGAGVAIGSVIALSQGSPNRPPGAR